MCKMCVLQGCNVTGHVHLSTNPIFRFWGRLSLAALYQVSRFGNTLVHNTCLCLMLYLYNVLLVLSLCRNQPLYIYVYHYYSFVIIICGLQLSGYLVSTLPFTCNSAVILQKIVCFKHVLNKITYSFICAKTKRNLSKI